MPRVPDSPKQQEPAPVIKKKKKKPPLKRVTSKVVTVVKERVEKPESAEETKSKKEKPRTNKLPPVEILFAHIHRVEDLKKTAEPVMQEISKRALKKTASFHSVAISSKLSEKVSGAKTSRSNRSKRKRMVGPDDIDSSGSQSPGPRIGSDFENDKISEKAA